MDVVDGTVPADALRAAISEPAVFERARAYQALTGCSDYRAVEVGALMARGDAAEQARFDAVRQARLDDLWPQYEAAVRATVDKYSRAGFDVPAAGLETARFHFPDDGAGRDRTAEYGSASRPAVFVGGNYLEPSRSLPGEPSAKSRWDGYAEGVSAVVAHQQAVA